MFIFIFALAFIQNSLSACPCNDNGICDPYLDICYCDDEFTGSQCQIKQSDAIECSECNNGSCDPQSGNCVCREGFSGEMCENQDVNCPGNCNGEFGNCQENGCDCKWPMIGPDCKVFACENNCHGNGICNEDSKCECNKGFAGDSCFFMIIS